MVFGGIEEERLQLNEDTLWSRRATGLEQSPRDEALPEIRKLVLEEKRYRDACDQFVCRKMQGPYKRVVSTAG